MSLIKISLGIAGGITGFAAHLHGDYQIALAFFTFGFLALGSAAARTLFDD
jgi:hypothetical protein